MHEKTSCHNQDEVITAEYYKYTKTLQLFTSWFTKNTNKMKSQKLLICQASWVGLSWGARYLTGDNLKVVWAEFSTLR
jgi:hypothetical protein